MRDLAGFWVRAAPSALAGLICVTVSAVIGLNVALSVLDPLTALLWSPSAEMAIAPEPAPDLTDKTGCATLPGGLVVCD
ncbi:MAG: hypothetical protein AAF192_03025 [Pseudomonadota bacterium]